MRRASRPLWLYGSTEAVVTSVFAFVIITLVVVAVRRSSGWPSEADLSIVILGALLVSLLPVWLLLLDYLGERGAKVGSKWFSVDFSAVDLRRSVELSEQVALPANLGVTGPMISDTTPLNIVSALREAADHDVALIDIRNGGTWWVTRLIAFAAGAARRGAPEAIVFVGRQNNKPAQFLGWSPPEIVLETILSNAPEYREHYDRGTSIARQVTLFRGNELIPDAQNFTLNHEVNRYINPPPNPPNPPPNYVELGAAATEQIIMDRFAQARLEEKPDRLTLARLEALLGAVLVREQVDLGLAGSKQVAAALAAESAFVALVRNGAFTSMLRRSDVDRAILRQLISADDV